MIPAAASLATTTSQPLTPPVAPPRLDAFQAVLQNGGNGPGIGQALTNAMDGFGARAAKMQATMRDVVSRDAGAGQVPATGEVQAPSGVDGVGAGAGSIQAPMALMMDCFNFSIQASLVSRAATQFTGSVSTLMKGQ